jgi:Asp-tRNA(Asn)/Glu-tRNA(Gln) amidotransferase A subunit family amidase
MMIVGRVGEDDTVLRVAHAYQSAHAPLSVNL